MTRRSYSATDRALSEIAAPVTPEDVCRAGNGIRSDAAGRHAPIRTPEAMHDAQEDDRKPSPWPAVIALVLAVLTIVVVGAMVALAAG